MTDSLSSASARRAGLDHLLNGIGLVNGLLGLRLPVPPLRAWRAEALEADANVGGDPYYLQLLGALFDLPRIARTHLPELMVEYGGFFEPIASGEVLAPAFAQVLALRELDDAALTANLRQLMSVRVLDHLEVLRPQGYVFVKINHFHWECVASAALQSAGLEYHRRLEPAELARVRDSRSHELLTATLRRVGGDLQASGVPAGTYDVPGFSLGVSFNNGDGLLEDDLRCPIPPVMRGAMLGSYGFFKGMDGTSSYRFTDGSFPKMLVWHGRMDDFFGQVKVMCDAIVFVGPDHLRNIRVRGWEGHTESIVVPPTMISELWPVVLPVVASRLATLFEAHRRVFVSIQAGHISVPLGILVQQMRSRFPATVVHCVDMGQAVDVAAFPKATGPWMRQPELQETLRRCGSFPLHLAE